MSIPAFASFEDFYRSDLQSAYALLPAPVLLLAWLLTSPLARARAQGGDPDARFVHLYTLFFACETILDPLATGSLARLLGYQGTGPGTAVLLLFVLLGDFRVFLLVLRLARPERGLGAAAGAAALATLIVPLIAWPSDLALRSAFPELPDQSIWLIYELGFLGVALFLRNVYLPAQMRVPAARVRYLRSVATYAAVYYALWALADVLILVGGLDVGWGLRAIPNQLYYAFYLPFVYFRFFSRR